MIDLWLKFKTVKIQQRRIKDLQAKINMMGEIAAETRRSYHLSLGELVKFLEDNEKLQMETPITDPHSYYEDLAFQTEYIHQNSKEALRIAKSCFKEFEGYKGGEFRMCDDTALWISDYGTSCGSKAILGIYIENDFVKFVTKEID